MRTSKNEANRTPDPNPRRRRRSADARVVGVVRGDTLFAAMYGAGRAVATLALGLPPEGAGSVDLEAQVEGTSPPRRARRGAEGAGFGAVRLLLLQLLSGPIAAWHVDRSAARRGVFDGELARAGRLIELAVRRPDEGPAPRPAARFEALLRDEGLVEEAVDQLLAEAGVLMGAHWAAVQAAAGRLLERGRLTRAEVEAIMAEHPPV